MDIKCRACLATTEAKMYHSLLTVFPEYMNTRLKVLDLLEIVTSTTISLSHDLPDSICTACLKLLKDCYKFITRFKDAQSWLENIRQEERTKSDQIIVKVGAIDEKFSNSAILDMDGNDIFLARPGNELEISENNKVGKGNTKSKTTTILKARKKREPFKKYIASRHIKRNIDGIIVMSVEDIGSKEKTDLSENWLDTTDHDLVSNEKNNKHNDHTYQKNYEGSREPNNLYIMPVNDVLNSTSRTRVVKSSGIKRKVTKGIITRSSDLVKNLERKMAIRRARRKTPEDKEAEENFTCDICLKIYESQKKMVSHKQRIHNSEWHEKFKCTICDLQCRTLSSFRHHQQKHRGKKYDCDSCEKIYLTSTQLKDHKKRAHGEGMPVRFLCPECGKRFKYSTGLKYHVTSVHHTENKPYMCRYCGFKCVQHSYLKRHERCHTNERPYKCKFCDRTFRGSAELQSHQLSHEGKYRCMCQYCGKGFIQSWNMKVHWLQHGGDFPCQICNRSFIDANVLSFHYFHHHKIRDGDRVECEYSYDEQENLDTMFLQAADDDASHDIF